MKKLPVREGSIGASGLVMEASDRHLVGRKFLLVEAIYLAIELLRRGWARKKRIISALASGPAGSV